MRICRIYSDIDLNPKGFGIGLFELSAAQRALKNEVYLITGDLASKKIRNVKYNDLSFNLIPYFRKIDVINAFFPFGLLSSFRLKQFIQKELIDLIHTHDVDAIYPIIRNKKVPLIQTFHVDKQAQLTRLGWSNISLRAKFIESYQFKLNYLIWKKSSAIICISKQTMKRLINYYKIPKSKVYYIPNGVNINKFFPAKDGSEIKISLKLDQYYPVILFIGRIHYLKGLKELIHSLFQLKKRYPKILLLIVGTISDPNYYNMLLSLIRKFFLTSNVKFLKSVPHSLIPRVYHASDIFILPSYSEGMPKVVLEAMASRLCTVTTNLEGNRDLIKNNFNGILINPKDVKQLSDSLLKIIEDDHLRQKLALNAWKTAQQYSWLEIAKKIQALYELVLQK